jgi:hypothetical protein
MNQLIWGGGRARYTCWSRTRTDEHTRSHTHTEVGMYTRGRQLGYASLFLASLPPKILERSELVSVAIRTRTSYRTVSLDPYAHRFLSFSLSPSFLSFCSFVLTFSSTSQHLEPHFYQKELHRLESYFHRDRLAWSRTRDPSLYGTEDGGLLCTLGLPIRRVCYHSPGRGRVGRGSII